MNKRGLKQKKQDSELRLEVKAKMIHLLTTSHLLKRTLQEKNQVKVEMPLLKEKEVIRKNQRKTLLRSSMRLKWLSLLLMKLMKTRSLSHSS